MEGLIPDFIAGQVRLGRLHGALDAVVLFADLKGFTGYTEEMVALGKAGAEKLSVMLDQVFGAAASAVHTRGGFIPHFAGDAFAGVFPSSDIQAALEAAGEIREEMLRLSVSIPLRIGVASGAITWQITEEKPHRWYVKGDGIRAAVATQLLANPGEIVLDAGLLPLFDQHNFTIIQEMGRHLLKDWAYNIPLSLGDPSTHDSTAFFPGYLHNRFRKGEFRAVTSLFIHIPDNLDDDMMARWLVTTCSIIERYQGYVKEMDFTDKGALLVSFFGAPVNAGDSRRNASDVALAIREKWDDSLGSIKIGMTTGPAFCGLAGNRFRRQYIVAGRAVNLAARLALSAPDDAIQTDAATLDGLPADKHSLGQITAKGFTVPMEVFTLNGFYHTDRDRDIFYRPDVILEELISMLSGKKGVVLQIVGKAGMGKTHVARKLSEWPSPQLCWLLLEGHPELTGPFEDLEYAWRHNASITANSQLLGAFDAIHRRKELPPRERYSMLKEAHLAAFRAYCPEGTCCLQIEHWEDIDRSSRDLIVRLLEESQISVFITSRHPVSQLQQIPHVQTTVYTLPELESTGIGLLIENILHQPAAPSLIDVLSRASSGNPFFAEQLLLYLKANDFIVMEKGGKAGIVEEELKLGGSLRDVLLARLDQLSEHTRTVLEYAAVMGMKIDSTVMQAVLMDNHIPLKQMSNCLEEAVAGEILRREDTQYFFRHSLIREMILELLLESRLKTLHRHIFRQIETCHAANLEPYILELSQHARDGDLPDKARYYYAWAGRRAISAYQNKEALKYFDLALSFSQDVRDTCRIMLDAAPAYIALGQWQEAMDLLADPILSEDNLDPMEMANLLFFKGQIFILSGQYPVAETTLNQALDAYSSLDATTEMARCSRELGILHFRQGRYHDAEQYIDRTFRLYGPAHPPDHALVVNLSLIRMNQGRYEEAESLLSKDLTWRLHTGEREPLPALYTNLSILHKEMGRLDLALADVEKAITQSESSGSQLWMSIALGTRGTIYELTGRWDDAIADYQTDMELTKKLGDPQGLAIAREFLGSLLVKKGLFQEGNDLLQASCEVSRHLDYKKGVIKCLQSLGLSYLWNDQPSAALPYLQEAVSLSKTLGHQRLTISTQLSLTEVLISLDQPDEAAHLLSTIHVEDPPYRDVLLYDWYRRLQWLLMPPEDFMKWVQKTDISSQTMSVQGEILLLIGKYQGDARILRQAIAAFEACYRHTPFVHYKHQLTWLHSAVPVS